MPVADKVKSIIVEQLGVDEEEVTPDASFVDDLGADSLDTVELVMAFEEEFGIEIPDEDAEKMDVVIQYALAAARFAIADARLDITPELSSRTGVFIASGIGGFTTIEREHKALLEGGPRKISPFFIPSAIINLAAGQVS